MCLTNTPFSEENKEEFRKHMTKVHSATCSLDKLADMCFKVEEKLKLEEWGFDDIIKEETERRESEEKRRAESGGLIGMFRKKLKATESELHNDEDEDDITMKCLICQGMWTGISQKEFKEHLRKRHKVIFVTRAMPILIQKFKLQMISSQTVRTFRNVTTF